MPPTTIEERLAALHAHYTSRINAAVAAGRMDLVRDLANNCQDEALDLILTLGGASSGGPSHPGAETLEIDGWSGWRGSGKPRLRRSWFWRRRSR